MLSCKELAGLAALKSEQGILSTYIKIDRHCLAAVRRY